MQSPDELIEERFPGLDKLLRSLSDSAHDLRFQAAHSSDEYVAGELEEFIGLAESTVERCREALGGLR